MSEYKIIKTGIKIESEAIIDNDIYYKCLECGDMMPSIPKDNIGCKCGKVFIDKGYHRLIVKNHDKFQILRKVG